MKTSVFPLDLACIDRSKIHENPMTSVSDSSFNDTNNSSVDNVSNNDNCISASDTRDMTTKHDNNQSTNNSIIQILDTDAPVVLLSITSDEPILLLDQVIQESVINEEEQDDDYYPASNTSATEMNTSLKDTQSSSQPQTTDIELQSNATKQGRSKKQSTSKIMVVESSKNEGKSNQILLLLMINMDSRKYVVKYFNRSVKSIITSYDQVSIYLVSTNTTSHAKQFNQTNFTKKINRTSYD